MRRSQEERIKRRGKGAGSAELREMVTPMLKKALTKQGVRACMCTVVCACMCACLPVCLCACVHVCVCVCAYVCASADVSPAYLQMLSTETA